MPETTASTVATPMMNWEPMIASIAVSNHVVEKLFEKLENCSTCGLLMKMVKRQIERLRTNIINIARDHDISFMRPNIAISMSEEITDINKKISGLANKVERRRIWAFFMSSKIRTHDIHMRLQLLQKDINTITIIFVMRKEQRIMFNF